MVAGVDNGGGGAEIRARLAGALRNAMRNRDAVSTSVLRSALSAIGNAEAVPWEGQDAGEVRRRDLSDTDIDAILRAEISERESAAEDYAVSGVFDQAIRLRAEAAVLVAIIAPDNS